MPRTNLILSSEHPYHVQMRSNNRDWFDLPLSYCYFSFIEVLQKTQEKYEIEVHLFLLMDNHIHMLVSTPKANISMAMRYLATEVSRRLRVASLRVNHIFGGRYNWSLVKSEEYYAHVYRYILRNPVKAGITCRIEDYPWSTFTNQFHKVRGLSISQPNGHHSLLPDGEELLKWLNTAPPSEVDDGIRRGLKKGEFQFPRRKNSRSALDWKSSLPEIARCEAKK